VLSGWQSLGRVSLLDWAWKRPDPVLRPSELPRLGFLCNSGGPTTVAGTPGPISCEGAPVPAPCVTPHLERLDASSQRGMRAVPHRFIF